MKVVAMILALAFVSPVAFVACDRTLESQTKVKTDDGKTTVQKKTVTESPSGEITETKERREVDNR